MKHFKSPHAAFWGGHRLPVVLQTEAAECGLACIAMVASYWGCNVDLPSLRRRFAVSLKGATLKALIGAARMLGLKSRPVKVEMAGLRHLQLPCVLHWGMNHFVVLSSVRRNAVEVHDPVVGRRCLSIAEASKYFTGVALELSPMADFKPVEERQRITFRSLIGRVVGLKRALGQLILLGLALQVCVLALPFYLQWIVDEAIVGGDRDLVTVLGLGFLLVIGLQTLIGGVRGWITNVFAVSLNFQWLGNAFAHLMRLPLPYFEKRHLGDIISRFGSIQTIQRSLTGQFVEGIIDGALMVGTVFLMFLYSPQLSMVAVGAVLLYLALRLALFRSMRNATAEQIIHAAKQQSHFLESVRAAQSVRLFDRADERQFSWMSHLADQCNAELRIAKLTVTYQSANVLLFNVERVAIIWLGALAVLDARFSLGMLFAFLLYKDQFSQRTASLIDKLMDFGMLRLHAERVADIVTSEVEPQDPDEGTDDSPARHHRIEIRNLSFRYSASEPFILEDVTFTIPPGQCIAITGASGCGKTTLVKLLLGLLEPTSGEIRIDGMTLKQFGVRRYRRTAGTVMQEDHLFAGSIADNIAFFDPTPNRDRIERCAVLAATHDEIMSMPMGYNSLVGEFRSGLSGGQKQRILLARALYKEPTILVLDEATSHLDVANEHQVNAAVRGAAMTRIIVAHRPETIAMAQRVIALEKGRVVRDFEQSGTIRQGIA